MSGGRARAGSPAPRRGTRLRPCGPFAGLRLLVLGVAAVWPSAAVAVEPLGLDGSKAFEMAKAADAGAAAARAEGEAAFAELEQLAGGQEGEAWTDLRGQAGQARAALEGYRAQAELASAETLRLLGEATGAARPAPADPPRRAALEQQALLAAHEAAVMAARARAEAERLRALRAEARVLALWGAAGGGREAAPPRTGRGVPSAGSPPAGRGSGPAGGDGRAGRGDEVVVPNLVGARLEAAARDLVQAGLRLGATRGPREGFVVKQAPEAGSRVPPRTAVNLTLSTDAVRVTPVAPR